MVDSKVESIGLRQLQLTADAPKFRARGDRCELAQFRFGRCLAMVPT